MRAHGAIDRMARFGEIVGRVLAPAVLAVSLLPPSLAAAEARPGPSVSRHDLSVALHPDRGSISATDDMAVLAGGAARLAFSLTPAATVRGVSVGGKALPPEAFSFRNGTLDVPVPPGDPERGVTVSVSYEAAFADPVPEDPVNTEDPGFGIRGHVSPRGTILLESCRWYPDLPGSAATFRVRVEAPAGIEPVTSGRLVRRTTGGGKTVAEWETAVPLDGIALSAGRYEVRESLAGSTPVYTYFYPETAPLAEKYHAAVARYLALYGDLLGPYPFEKFAVVENFYPTGYGFPSWTLLGSSVVRLPFIVETSLGHEIAHSWWGNGVLVDDARGNWAEGLTTYVADYLYKERASAAEGREYRLKLLRDYATLVAPERDLPLRAFRGRSDPATRAVGYGKGAMVFHMARRQAGEAAFWKGLREVARERFGRTAAWTDFDRAISRQGGPDLAPFFAQWVDRPGAPVVSLRDVAAVPEGGRWKVTGRLVQEKPYYEIEVPVRLVAGGKATDAVLTFTGEDIRFALWSDARPDRLVVDPEADVFRRLDPAEIPALVNGIKGSRSLVAVASRDLPKETLEAAKILFTAMGFSGGLVLPEEQADPERLAAHDVLFLGVPANRGLLPRLPPDIEADAGGFRLKGVRYGRPGDALFAALPHPAGGGRVAALFLPLSPGAAAAAGRKVTHYGKYSYLAFSDGENRDKGTWEPAAAPTVHVFPGDTGTGR